MITDLNAKQAVTDDFRALLTHIGKGWRKPIKMHDRVPSLSRKYSLINKFLSEYQDGGSSVIDFSCGNGTLIEIMRHYGNTVMGVEHFYFDYLRSQDLPFTEWNCDHLPYPFSDKSYGLVSCIGSLTFYDANWTAVLDEFFRIARDCVFVIVNKGDVKDQKISELENYRRNHLWKRVDFKDDAVYKWVRA